MIMKRNYIFIPFILILFTTACTSDKSFGDYKLKEFTFQGHEAKIVFPDKAHDKRHWIWRARFWGHEPQLDLALLDQGFHLVYVDVADLYGNDEAIQRWNDFYDFCTTEYKLNPKVVLEGMSRGGLIVYNWASRNTDKVFAIYADAPVCDIKSWPGGLYDGAGSPESWKTCLEAHGLDTLSVLDYKNIPLHTCVNVAKANVPVIHVYGNADKVVPHEENTVLLKNAFLAAGGSFQVIVKEGVGHHPHALEDPAPLVDFIMNSIY